MIEIKAYAKVNLFINVLGLREDGYHNLEMINTKIDLYDTVKITKTDSPDLVIIRSNDLFLSNQNNIVFDTASYMIHHYVPDQGVIIDIDKKIPFGAGLAGNSADSAAIIQGVNELFQLGLTDEEMAEIGVRFGADVPYCLQDETALVEGIGEKITPIPLNLKSKRLFLLNPRVYVQTKDIFSIGDRKGFDNVDSHLILDAAKNNDVEAFIAGMHNALQPISIGYDKEVQKAYQILCDELGASGLVMTGSGSTFVKVISPDDESVRKFIKKHGEQFFMSVYQFL